MKILVIFALFYMLAPIGAFALMDPGGGTCSNQELRGYIAGKITVSDSGVRSIHFNGANMTYAYLDRMLANKDSLKTKHGGSGGDASDLKIFVTEDFIGSSNVTLNIFARTESGNFLSDQDDYWLPDLCGSGSVGYEKFSHFTLRVSKSDALKVTANGGSGTNGYRGRNEVSGQGGDAGSGGRIEVYYDNVDLIKNLTFEVYPGYPGKGSEGALMNFYSSGADGQNGRKGLVLLVPITKMDFAIRLEEELKLKYPHGVPQNDKKTIKFMTIENKSEAEL